MSIQIINISKKFGAYPAVLGASFTIEPGKLVALLGPSGSGKTTLLRLIAGLEFPDHGRILFQGEDVTNRSAFQRKAGFVFQHYALFANRTVFGNIAFGLEMQRRQLRLSKSDIRQKVDSLLKVVQLEEYADHFPSQLSGGQRQRVAFARALAVQPELLLLDEPFGALDAKVRKELRLWLKEFHSTHGITTLFVTHDQDDAFEIADEIIVLAKGVPQQIGTADELRSNPTNPVVRDFLGIPL